MLPWKFKYLEVSEGQDASQFSKGIAISRKFKLDVLYIKICVNVNKDWKENTE